LKKAQEEVVALKEQILKNAEAEKDAMINEARAQAEEIIQQAEKTRKSLLAELEERIAKEAVNKACELIQNTVPEQFREMHAYWVEDLLRQGFSRLEHLSIPADIQEIKLVSAFEITEQQRKNILKKLKEVLGRENFKLKEKIDSKIVAGIVISIGSLVLDGSFRNKIQEEAKSAQQQPGNQS
jgi:F0F1-type ATP synthase delta subunit